MNLNFLDTIFSDLPNGGSSIKKSFATLPKHTPTNQSNKKKPTQLEDRTLIKIHDPFKKAYDCLKGIIQNNHGLDQIVSIAEDQVKAIQKLKNKHFMVTKNQTKRGKKHPSSLKKVVSRKVQRSNALFELKSVQYSDVEPLTEMWKEYIKELMYEQKDASTGKIKEPTQTEFLKLLRASFHMAPIIAHQKNSVPISGIVIKETYSTFCLITPKNEHKTIVKAQSLFDFEIGDRTFRIVGASMGYRADERIRVKWKLRNWTKNVEGVIGLDGNLVNKV